MKKPEEPLEFGIYTKVIVDEAESRGIKVRGFLDVNQNNAILTYKGHTEWIAQVMTNRLGKVTDRFLHNKAVVNRMLKESGIPVSNQILTDDIKEIRAFLKKKKKIVLKPLDRSGGQGITIGITKASQILTALRKAQAKTWRKDRKILCEQHIVGVDNRVLIIDKKYIFSVQRIPAFLIGDGQKNIRQLVYAWNKELPLENRKIHLDKDVKKLLKKQGLQVASIPAKNKKFLLGTLGNAYQGALSVDTTDILCKEVKRIAKKIATMFNVPVLGVDFLSTDISKRPGKIIELNTYPGLSIHHFPTIGKPRNPAARLVDMLFPETIKKRRG